MNESSDSHLQTILTTDFNLVQSSSKKCSLKKLLCQCSKSHKIKNKSYYISKWRKYLTNESSSLTSINDPFTILTNLWAHKPNIIQELEQVRINPNLITNANHKTFIFIRNDLEFYLPQLLSFILFGQVELVEEAISFLCKASYSSVFFAHRVIWFLKSMLSPQHTNTVFNNKIKNILHIIQTIYKSDNESNKKALQQYHICGNELYLNYLSSSYINNTISTNARFTIKIFNTYGYCTNSGDDVMLFNNSYHSLKQIDPNDVNLSSFLSNINFYDHLCNISERIRYYNTHNERESELYKELCKLNKELPYNVYIPFSHKCMRNYIIVSFCVKDCKVFKTKERAPIMFTCECVRVEEVCIEEDKSLLLDGNKNYEMEHVGMINDSVIKRNYDKISYLMAVDIGLSKPIFVGKRKGGGKVDNKEGILSGKDELKEKKEEEYKRIEKAVKEVSLDQDEDVNDTSLTTKDSNYEMINTKSANKRKKSSSSEDNDSPVSDSESEFTVSVNNSNNNSIILDNNSIAIENDFDKSNYFNISSMSFSSIFGETLSLTESRLKSQSKYSSFTTFKVFKFIIKTGEDFLQEQFASQLINVFAQIFKIEKVDIFLYPYEVLSLNHNAGIIEVIPNAITIDELKRKTSISNQLPLKSFYEKYFGVNTPKYKKAIKHFIQSLAGYSLVCYFLQIKDRHNGNIMINNDGYLIHIDFGFLLSHAPGREFETAPFKLTNEIVDVFGGVNSKNFEKYRKMMWKGMIAISKHYEKIMVLVEMMYCGYGKELKCFEGGEDTLKMLRQRFKPKENMKKRDYLELVDNLIQQAMSSWSTKWYDKYQYYFQGIFY